MTSIQLAAQLLRQYVAAAHSPDQQPDVPGMVNEVYPADLDRPADIAEIVHGHLVLGSLLISMAAKATGRSPHELLDAIIAHETPPS